ncbi:DUF6443 domain-containing protein [Sphingobacterium siyangense]|uniref:DUF6443 domain-containing protein n=1 Tax=Sphingobacterium siyangense TaxID=459529 RepID=UPI0019633488|nr:DUF6443 domain-containing protein [Sphingobacterium siyangense]QRY58013.1 RHS repeat-associated core domain-containing protein [Sphingobacterium siyangense]
MKSIYKLISILLLYLFSLSKLFSQDLTFTSYSNQSEISATGSITLKPGFHIPTGQNARIFITGIPSQPLNASLSANQNYIVTNTFRKAYTTIPTNPTTNDFIQEVAYFDGLGRQIQTVTTKASPTFKDIVEPQEYDGFGRESKKYLPYSSAETPGAFKASAYTAQATFYNTPPSGVAGSPHPFSLTVFENSPLNRELEQGAPGAFWQPQNTNITGSGHTIKKEYGTNNTTAFTDVANTKRVNLYGVSLSTDGVPSLTINGAYGAGQLYVYVTKDENWIASDGRAGTKEEYVDKEGRTVLKRVFNKKNDGGIEMLSTYFVFDDFGDLTYVLTPGRIGVFDPDGATLPTATQLNDFCYQYRFDGRRRMVEKKVPGKDVEYLVYNKNDQVVLTQDGIQRAKSPKEWTFTKYDAFSRVVMSGKYTTTLTLRTDVQALVDGYSVLWESPLNTNPSGYANTSFPSGNGAEVYSYVYYDNYDLPSDCPAEWKTLASSYSKMIKSLRTATKTKILGTTGYLWNVEYYDDYGQVTRTNAQHQHGGTDIVENTYNFPGELTESKRTHTKGSTTTIIKERNEYDHQGRLVNTYHQVNTQPEVLLVSNAYNEVGTLITKKLHSENGGGNFLQKLDYLHNIRGWLTSINGTTLNATENDLFGLDIKYTDDDRQLKVYPGQYNGNISEVIWNSSRTNKLRGYAFKYDNVYRLLAADFRAFGTNWTADPENNRFTEADIAYDKMGNILQLKRNGTISATAFGVMDDLTYTYAGNKLMKVDEKSTGNRSYGFKEPTPTASDEFTYDVNGNLKTDVNKGITAVSYNYLNLPEQVTIGGNNIIYQYDASGIKLKKTAGSNITNYINGIHYIGDQINFIQTAEGRILRSPSTGLYSYEYQVKDHQDNVRLAFDKDPSTSKARIIQEDSYYPFGLTFNSFISGDRNKYLFQKQEFQDEYGLNWSQFKWRMHDPAIGRFTSIDPLATDYTHNSPYAFSENRVINGVELEGLEYMTYGYDAAGVRANIQATAQRINRTETEKMQELDFFFDIFPVVGDAKGIAEVFYGKKIFSKQTLSDSDKALALAFMSEVKIAGEVADVAKNTAKIAKTVNKAENVAVKETKTASELLKEGRSGKQEKLANLGKDGKVSSKDRGWIKQEQNSIARGKRETIRNPPGKQLAHKRGKEAAKGYSYEHSNLQDEGLHRLQHKHDDYGRKNKENPN